MVLLILFGFLAGAGTALSPCVLPVLPIALSAGATGGRRRPLGIVVGLAISFTFATVVLVYVISALGLPGDLLRKLAISVLLVFGVSLMAPPLAARIEAAMSRFVGSDVHGGSVSVDSQRLYQLVDLPRVGRHLLRLELEPGVSAYAFTFG
jgi:cytochrome c biogenesis protein CcdA